MEAYHFLVSIAPETIEKALPEYTQTVSASPIQNFTYEKQVLQLNFLDGSSYEYFDVPRTLYSKLLGSDNLARFCRRHIYHEFIYRKTSKAVEA
ncbi:MAG: KTSC domain-containing protein [Sphingobacteriales bacterium]|nr:MAG: KTSC domain-containing protein [Sphingobacteriales bacterium]